MTSSDRYEQNPLFRLIEFYVLWAIDALPDGERKTLEAMAPKLTTIYGGDGSWQRAIAAAMHFPPDMPDTIRQMWVENSQIARDNHMELEAQDFAQMFVDANFAD